MLAQIHIVINEKMKDKGCVTGREKRSIEQS